MVAQASVPPSLAVSALGAFLLQFPHYIYSSPLFSSLLSTERFSACSFWCSPFTHDFHICTVFMPFHPAPPTTCTVPPLGCPATSSMLTEARLSSPKPASSWSPYCQRYHHFPHSFLPQNSQSLLAYIFLLRSRPMTCCFFLSRWLQWTLLNHLYAFTCSSFAQITWYMPSHLSIALSLDSFA